MRPAATFLKSMFSLSDIRTINDDAAPEQQNSRCKKAAAAWFQLFL
jgi:hypothetical protein